MDERKRRRKKKLLFFLRQIATRRDTITREHTLNWSIEIKTREKKIDLAL